MQRLGLNKGSGLVGALSFSFNLSNNANHGVCTYREVLDCRNDGSSGCSLGLERRKHPRLARPGVTRPCRPQIAAMTLKVGCRLPLKIAGLELESRLCRSWCREIHDHNTCPEFLLVCRAQLAPSPHRALWAPTTLGTIPPVLLRGNADAKLVPLSADLRCRWVHSLCMVPPEGLCAQDPRERCCRFGIPVPRAGPQFCLMRVFSCVPYHAPHLSPQAASFGAPVHALPVAIPYRPALCAISNVVLLCLSTRTLV